MREGWVNDDYLILFEGDELRASSDQYSFSELLPGYRLLGLRGWDDFIVDDNAGNLFIVPTVPVSTTYLTPFQMPDAGSIWTSDERCKGKIKWYVKPLVFGGDPASPENIAWITTEQHAQAVRFWNGIYRSMKPSNV